ncbi:hypothetical protein ACRJ4W_12140 [Streptomyces sp. GLT-R25]
MRVEPVVVADASEQLPLRFLQSAEFLREFDVVRAAHRLQQQAGPSSLRHVQRLHQRHVRNPSVDDQGDEFGTGPGDVHVDAHIRVSDAVACGLGADDELRQMGVLLRPVATAPGDLRQQPVCGLLQDEVTLRPGVVQHVRGTDGRVLEVAEAVCLLRVGQRLAHVVAERHVVSAIGEVPVEAAQLNIELQVEQVRDMLNALLDVLHEGDLPVMDGQEGDPCGQFLEQGIRGPQLQGPEPAAPVEVSPLLVRD